jgi:galactokinase
MTLPPHDIAGQLQECVKLFEHRFGRPPRFAAMAPGRVNLIGEHTDYSDGFVMPMAIERQTILVADRAAGGRATVVAADMGGEAEREAVFSVEASLEPGRPQWANYVRGVVKACLDRGLDPGGFDALVHSTVPLGGGLSSSAALEVATATLIETMVGRALEPADKALACQWAEHEFPGVPCGIMDQFISTLGRADHAMLLDCRSLQTRMVPLADPELTVLIINSHVRHELSGGEYAQRRAQCAQAAAELGVAALRDADMAMLESKQPTMDPVGWRRARHVISENARTLRAADALAAGNWQAMGALMYQSHDSLRDDFEVSCAELDLLVTLAGDERLDGEVFGSRMTGGGFGGCTVTLVRQAAAEHVARHISDQYQQRTGISCSWFATRPAAGAREVEIV